jgi:hypothetical protein
MAHAPSNPSFQRWGPFARAFCLIFALLALIGCSAQDTPYGRVYTFAPFDSGSRSFASRQPTYEPDEKPTPAPAAADGGMSNFLLIPPALPSFQRGTRAASGPEEPGRIGGPDRPHPSSPAPEPEPSFGRISVGNEGAPEGELLKAPRPRLPAPAAAAAAPEIEGAGSVVTRGVGAGAASILPEEALAPAVVLPAEEWGATGTVKTSLKSPQKSRKSHKIQARLLATYLRRANLLASKCRGPRWAHGRQPKLRLRRAPEV